MDTFKKIALVVLWLISFVGWIIADMQNRNSDMPFIGILIFTAAILIYRED